MVYYSGVKSTSSFCKLDEIQIVVCLFHPCQVRIYYNSLEVTEIKDSPRYTLGSFVNELGGCLSLFLGISMVMVFELIELIARMIASLACCIISNKNHSQAVADDKKVKQQWAR